MWKVTIVDTDNENETTEDSVYWFAMTDEFSSEKSANQYADEIDGAHLIFVYEDKRK